MCKSYSNRLVELTPEQFRKKMGNMMFDRLLKALHLGCCFMNHQKINLLILLLTSFVFAFCSMRKPFNEKDKVFHAAPSTQGIGSLSFALYNDNRYQIMNSGGIGASYYQGKYRVSGDTIILEDLNKESLLKSNRLLIIRYKDQTDSFWRWKNPDIKDNEWQLQITKTPQTSGWASGEVYQIDENNQLMRNSSCFYIRLDSLESNR
jgi:hypothetical protein